MRTLASIQRIIDITPIPNADAIEKVTVLGWHCVAKKGEFSVGDLCVYFEIDSLLPIRPEFEFLANKGIKKMVYENQEREGYLLKTVRLRGQISQGLALPLTSLIQNGTIFNRRLEIIVRENLANLKLTVAKDRISCKFQTEEQKEKYLNHMLGFAASFIVHGDTEFTGRARITLNNGVYCSSFVIRHSTDYERKIECNQNNLEGLDLTALLDIIKYEPPIPAQLAGQVRGIFPSFIPKTDETRIQTVPHIIERYKDTPFYVTEKLDGCSMTVYKTNDDFGVCSRNLNLKRDQNNSLWKAAIATNLETNLLAGYAIQGELIGEGIQGNPYKIKGQKFYAFNVYDIEKGRYLSFDEFLKFVGSIGVEHVPILHLAFNLYDSVDRMVDYATRKSEFSRDILAEGVVIRPHTEAYDPDLGRLSFKVINPEYLL